MICPRIYLYKIFFHLIYGKMYPFLLKPLSILSLKANINSSLYQCGSYSGKSSVFLQSFSLFTCLLLLFTSFLKYEIHKHSHHLKHHFQGLQGSEEASQTVCVLLHASVIQERGSTCPGEIRSNSDYLWIFCPILTSHIK